MFHHRWWLRFIFPDWQYCSVHLLAYWAAHEMFLLSPPSVLMVSNHSSSSFILSHNSPATTSPSGTTDPGVFTEESKWIDGTTEHCLGSYFKVFSPDKMASTPQLRPIFSSQMCWCRDADVPCRDDIVAEELGLISVLSTAAAVNRSNLKVDGPTMPFLILLDCCIIYGSWYIQ